MGTNGHTLRVALLSRYPPDASNIRNGVQAASTYLIKGLAKISDLELHVLTFRRANWEGPDRYDHNGVSMHLLAPYPRFERLRNYATYQRILNERLLQIRPDIIHAQGASSDALVALRSGYPTLVTAHGIRREEQKYYKNLGERIRGFIDGVLTEQRVIRNTRYLIAISNYLIQYFASQFRPDLRYFLIPNAIDESFFNLGPVNKIPVSEMVSKPPIVLYAGRVTRLKRVMALVQSFASVMSQVPSAQLRIAGDCSLDFPYSESVRSWIHQAGLEDHIQMLGELNQDAILREFDRCDVFVLPSAQENAPIVLAQAMAAGKPVVATRVGGVADMLGEENERGLLINVGDDDALATALKRLLLDPAFCARLGQAGHTFAKENYHLDRVAQRTFEVYQIIASLERRLHA